MVEPSVDAPFVIKKLVHASAAPLPKNNIKTRQQIIGFDFLSISYFIKKLQNCKGEKKI
jgi:hypothetical protein